MARVVFEQVTKRSARSPPSTACRSTSRDGEIVVVVGPCGCGKTTTLRLVAGLEELDGGSHPDRRARSSTGRPAGAGHRDGVPGIRAVSADDRPREPRVCAADAQGARPRSSAASTEAAGHARHRAHCSSAVRASCRAGSGRGSRWAGRSCASPQVFLMDEPLSNLDAKLRGRRAPRWRLQREVGDDRALRHARPGRGDDDRRPHRRDERGRPRAGRRPGAVYERPAKCSWQGSSAARR